MNKRSIGLLALALLMAAAAGYFYLHFQPRADGAPAKAAKGGFPKAAASVPVIAAPAVTTDVGVRLEALGSVTPVATVTVRSRVDGELVKILFKEGQMVRAGAMLAELDSRSFAVALAQAQATLARDQALLQNAKIDLERYKVLYQQDSIAQQQLDTQSALVRQYEATVKLDQAAVDSARLQLSYTQISAPVGGRIGLRQVDLGNIVRAADANGIVVITELQPIAVVFSIAEDNVRTVMKKLAAGEKLTADAYDRTGQSKLASGTLLTADNQIDPTTGTVKLKALFENKDFGLFPGQFVNVRLQVEVLRGATVVPGAAVQRGTPGTFVYVVNPESKSVSVRRVKLGPAQGDLVAIEQGLTPGTLVVVDGADKLREGATVEMVERDAAARQSAAAQAASPEERLKRWKALNARIDKGEFGEEMRKLPEEGRKQRMRELSQQKGQ